MEGEGNRKKGGDLLSRMGPGIESVGPDSRLCRSSGSNTERVEGVECHVPVCSLWERGLRRSGAGRSVPTPVEGPGTRGYLRHGGRPRVPGVPLLGTSVAVTV